MQIKQSVTVNRPREEVWALFQDIPVIAGCMPGAELTRDNGDGRYAGVVSIKLGPFKAAFEGEVQHQPDHASFSGKAEGRGVDKKGGSRSRMTMNYALADKGDATDLAIDAEIQLSGPVAQFGRPGIVSETAKLLIQQFVANVEAELNGDGAAGGTAKELSALKLGGKVVGASVKRWLGKEG
jgi:carbon monoxide dehydrogenase subunit G